MILHSATKPDSLTSMSEWQPIETAPKDGTQFAACNLKYALKGGEDLLGPAIVRWDSGAYADEGGWVVSGGWMRSWAKLDDFDLGDPTHWVPLPDPSRVK